jgi:hypothetical protein
VSQVHAAVAAAVVRTITVVRVRARHTERHAAHGQPRAGAPRHPFPAPVRTPTPLSIAPVLTETHSPGGFTGFALGAGALGAFLLVFLGYAAPGLQTARSQPGRAHPDPPG